MRRVDVLVVNVLGFIADSAEQSLLADLDLRLVAAFNGIAESKVCVARELRVDRQVDESALVRRQLDSEFNAVARALLCRGILLVLGGREDFRENASELDFAENTPRFDVREYLFEVADAHREVLHLAQALVNLLEPLTDERKAVAELLVEALVELFVDRAAHFVELTGVVSLNIVEPLFHGIADRVKAAAVLSRKALKPLLKHTAHRADGVLGLRGQLLPQLALLPRDIRADLPREILFVDLIFIRYKNYNDQHRQQNHGGDSDNEKYRFHFINSLLISYHRRVDISSEHRAVYRTMLSRIRSQRVFCSPRASIESGRCAFPCRSTRAASDCTYSQRCR